MNNAVDVFDSIADDVVNVGSLSARSFVVTDRWFTISNSTAVSGPVRRPGIQLTF